MLFNSIDFAIFVPAVFVLYWFVAGGNLRAQNVVVLLASYVFYGWWDWRFLSLIVLSSAVDYAIGRGLARAEQERPRRLLLLTSLTVNLGLFGTFKYFNFFAESFADAFLLLGRTIDPARLDIILPVGISFYTFQTLSYSIDVYNRKLEPAKDALAFFSFVAFFPQLVAGPIERARNLLPQMTRPRSFDYDRGVDGLRQILWGLFKKVVIADNAAVFVNDIFANHASYSGSTLFIGALLFAFQIYADFSGYSDIAIGTARLFGFDLMRNFAFPYFSRDIAEFWRRWHISLSTWFRDYLYIPLGGSRGSTANRIRNTFVIFLVSGFWHGANWTFLAWGFLHALYFLPLLLLKRNRRHTDTVAAGARLPSLREFGQISTTFLLTLIAWVFFRAQSIGEAFVYLGGMFSPSLFAIPEVFPVEFMVAICAFVAFEWHKRDREHALEVRGVPGPRALRWAGYYALMLSIALFGGGQQDFIYFQF